MWIKGLSFQVRCYACKLGDFFFFLLKVDSRTKAHNTDETNSGAVFSTWVCRENIDHMKRGIVSLELTGKLSKLVNAIDRKMLFLFASCINQFAEAVIWWVKLATYALCIYSVYLFNVGLQWSSLIQIDRCLENSIFSPLFEASCLDVLFGSLWRHKKQGGVVAGTRCQTPLCLHSGLIPTAVCFSTKNSEQNN